MCATRYCLSPFPGCEKGLFETFGKVGRGSVFTSCQRSGAGVGVGLGRAWSTIGPPWEVPLPPDSFNVFLIAYYSEC